MKYYQPVYSLGADYFEYFAPNIYTSKEQAELYLNELEKALNTEFNLRYVRDLFVDNYEGKE